MRSDSFLVRLTNFAQSTDAHGVKFVSDVGTVTAARRWVWSVALLGAFGFLGYFFYARVTYFLRYESTSLVEYHAHLSAFSLPSVLVCPQRQGVSVSRLTPPDIVLAPTTDLGSLDLNLTRVTTTQHDQLFIRHDAVDFFRRLRENSSLLFSDEAAQFFQLESDSWAATLSYERTGQTQPDARSVYSTQVLNWRPTISQLAAHNSSVPISPEYSRSAVLKAASLPAGDVRLYAKCFRLSPTTSEVSCPPWEHVVVPASYRYYGFSFGSCFLIEFDETGVDDAWIGLTSSTASRESVYRMDVADRYEWDVLVDYGGSSQSWIYDTKDGSNHKVFVQQITNLHRLGPPFSPPCGTPDLLNNPRHHLYSLDRCLTECTESCVAETALTELGCLPSLYEPPHDNPHVGICSTNTSALRPPERWTTACRESCSNDTRSCPPFPCVQRLFQFSTSPSQTSFTWGDLNATEHTGRSTHIILGKNGASVATVVTEKPLYPVESLLAELGGTMGLFVGISLLTILHCVEFAFFECAFLLRRVVCRTRTDHVRNVSPAFNGDSNV